MRYRLESKPTERYTADPQREQRGTGPEGWTRRDEFGEFESMDTAWGVAFSASNEAGVEVFAVVPVDEEEEGREEEALCRRLLEGRGLTPAEGERMRDLLASGPLSLAAVDTRLIELRLAQHEWRFDEKRCVVPSQWASRAFYTEDGSVAPLFRWF